MKNCLVICLQGMTDFLTVRRKGWFTDEGDEIFAGFALFGGKVRDVGWLVTTNITWSVVAKQDIAKDENYTSRSAKCPDGMMQFIVATLGLVVQRPRSRYEGAALLFLYHLSKIIGAKELGSRI